MSDRKRCPRCDRDKPLEDFNRNPRSKDGYQGYCRSCQRDYAREWAEANRKRNEARWAAEESA